MNGSLFLDEIKRVHAKGVVLCERVCFCLLSAFYNTPPLLRTLLRTSVSIENPYKAPSKNPSKKHLLVENLLRTLLRSVRLHDPLGVRPSKEEKGAGCPSRDLVEPLQIRELKDLHLCLSINQSVDQLINR